MRHRVRESGFGLVSALFLLVVLSSVAAFMVNLTGVGRTTVNFAILSAHAYQASRSGVEWGIWQLTNNGTCFADTDLNLTVFSSDVIDGDILPVSEQAKDSNRVRIQADMVFKF